MADGFDIVLTPATGRVAWAAQPSASGSSTPCTTGAAGRRARGHRIAVAALATLIAALVVAGCGSSPDAEADSSASASTSSGGDQGAGSDGVVSADEAASASALVGSDDIASKLLTDHGGELTSWEPAELEGERRGAFARIQFRAPVSMAATMVIRHRPGVAVTSVDDYVPERVAISPETVEAYGVAVDLVTMTIVQLAPMPAPPTTVVPQIDG
jgi:hypothetical protein